MKNGKFLYNAALAFGLVVASPAFADVTGTVDPSTMTLEERQAYRTQRQSEMSGMTPEQRGEIQSRGQGQGTMARDGSGSGGQYGRSGGGKQGGGMGGGYGRGR